MRDTPARNNRCIDPSLLNCALWLVFVVSVTAVGCASSVPMGTARRAVEAVRKGNLDEFRSQLTPEAQPKLGTNEGMNTIRQRLAQYKNLSVGPALVVSSNEGSQGYGHSRDIQRTYKATVTGSSREGAPPEAIYTFLLNCSIQYQETARGTTETPCVDNREGVTFMQCQGDTPIQSAIYRESCSIAKIEGSQGGGED